MKLIVNADDFGLCRGINYGIVDAFRFGIVRSTTIMAGGTAFAHAVELAKKTPGLGVGIHLTLTYGRPLSHEHTTLVDSHGNFYKQPTVLEHPERLDTRELECELSAQIEMVLASGIQPTHLDSHHHVHLLPRLLPLVCRLARHYDLPIRTLGAQQLPQEFADVRCPDDFTHAFYGPDVSGEKLIGILNAHADTQVLEVMAHPAYVDAALLDGSSYNLPRVHEQQALTSENVKRHIQQNNIELCNYSVLKPDSNQLMKYT